MTTMGSVLLAEDDRDEIFLLRWAFQRARLGHQIFEVSDGVGAIEYLSATTPYDDRVRYPLPQLLLLDLKMPKVNGFEVLAWLGARPEFKYLPVVVLSSSVFQADFQKAKDLGARECLTKPYDVEELVVVVKGIHERWLNPPALTGASIVDWAQTGNGLKHSADAQGMDMVGNGNR